MENLNDVEFGSDKGSEEAPILVAQRYLNIFRQVHIFNKQKRDQFDDELLALPQNVFDLFKKMPGGRLLVEHIEAVKEERGISFVKSSRDEFLNGTEETSNDAFQAVPSVGGGSVVMDASFAETFAKSMAAALKQIPGSSSPLSSATVNLPKELSNVFEIIAEEIHSSRASLLEVLKETKNITDTVVASQVSISRILDSILSARQRDDTGISELNNRIIASQASITRLLEKLCNRSDSFTDDVQMSDKLSHFKKEILSDVKSLLSTYHSEAHAEMLSDSFSQNKVSSQYGLSAQSDIKSDYSAENINDANANRVTVTTEDAEFREQHEQQNAQSSKKKKKKKQKKELKQDALAAEVVTPSVVADEYSSFSEASPNMPSSENHSSTSIEGIIHNDAYIKDDELNHISLDEQPLEIGSTDEETPPVYADDVSLQDFISDMPSTEDDTNFADKDLDNVLNDNVTGQYENINQHLDLSNTDDVEDKNIVSQNSISDGFSDISDLDNFVSDDDFDFELPEQTESVDGDISRESIPTPTDGVESDDELDFSLPQENLSPDMVSDVSLSDDNLSDLDSFVAPTPAIEDFEIDQSKEDGDTDIDMDISSDLDTVSDKSINLDDDDDSSVNLDTSTVGAINHPEEKNDSDSQESYSSELDKIRMALTNQDVDLSSLDEPIELDDYSDDENIKDEENIDALYDSDNGNVGFQSDDTISQPLDDSHQNDSLEIEQKSQDKVSDDDDWEWEYVDENGNIVSAPQEADDDDWEWEYVEDDGNENEPSNHENKQ